MNWLYRIIMIAMMFVLTACPKPLALTPPTSGPVTGSPETSVLKGLVDFADRRQIQATIDHDIALGATVGLIRVSDGKAVSTTLTDAKGQFRLVLSNGFSPADGELYYLDAIKGLGNGDGKYNSVGGASARVRTLICWQGGGYQTLTGRDIRLTQMTTAVCIVISMRARTGRPIDAAHQLTLLETVSTDIITGGYPEVFLPDTFTRGTPPLLPLTMLQRTYDLVADALAKNCDPLRWVALATSDPDRNTVILPDAPFSVQNLSPQTAAAGDNITLVGSNFGQLSDNSVAFMSDSGATVSATLVSLSPDCSRLTVTVPLSAVSGTIYLTNNGKTLAAPVFGLSIRNGHGGVDPSGNVYMANRSMNTISVTQPLPGQARLGVRALLSTGLSSPGALTFGREGYPWLYVACGGDHKIYKVDVSALTPTPIAVSNAGGFSNPTGIAYDYYTGNYYIADASSNTLYMQASGSMSISPVTLNGVTLSQPHGLSFGPDRKLYIANTGANNVLCIDPSNNNGTVPTSGLSGPWGVAFDNRGSFYVSNNTGNSVYRKLVTSGPGVTPLVYSSLSSFASIPTPGGMDADASGYIFVADVVTNSIWRINRQAETCQVAYGISYPTSICADASGQYILTDAGRILYFNSTTNTLSVYAEGLNTALGLVRDGSGNLYTNQANIRSIVKIFSDGSSVPIKTWAPGNYSFNNCELHMSGTKLYLRSANSYDPVHRTYFGSQGECFEYDLSDLSAPTRTMRTVPRRAFAIARDEAAGSAYFGYYYTIQPDENTLVRVQRINGANARITPFVAADPVRLVDMRSLHVDPSGNVWVICYAGQSGNGGLYVYNQAGTLIHDYSASVTKPVVMRQDGDGAGVYIDSYQANGRVDEISYTNGSVLRSISGLSYPCGFTFNGTTMYVDEAGTGRIGTIATYKTAPGAFTPFIGGGYADILFRNNGLNVISGGSIQSVALDGVTWSPIIYEYYGICNLFLQSDNDVAFVESPGWLNLVSDGYWCQFSGNLDGPNSSYFGRGDFGPGLGTCAVTPISWFSYGRGGAWTNLTETAWDGSWTRTFYYGQDFGGATSDGVNTCYLTQLCDGALFSYSNGTFSGINGSGLGAIPNSSMGICYYSGKVYQTLHNVHRVDVTTFPGNARSALPIGLVAPEL